MPESSRFDAPTAAGPATAPPRDTPTILNVPGLDNSGPDHWQTRWERRFPWVQRVELGLWSRPDRNVWVQRLDQAVRRSARPVILVAHSLGCLAVGWWAALLGQGYREPVAGALLVAPADPEHPLATPCIAQFGPSPRLPLPFPSILVASRNDPYAVFDRSVEFARNWGSHLVDAGEAGHLNADSALGDWPLGLSLVDRLVDAASLDGEAGRGPARSAQLLSLGVRSDLQAPTAP